MSYNLIIKPYICEDLIEEKQLYEYDHFRDLPKKKISINPIKKWNIQIYNIYKDPINTKIYIEKSLSSINPIKNKEKEYITSIKYYDNAFYISSLKSSEKQIGKCKNISSPKIKKTNTKIIVNKEEDYHQTCSCYIDIDNKYGWISLKDLYDNKNNGYILKEGDVLKLGRITFKIRETKMSFKKNENPNFNSDFTNKFKSDNENFNVHNTNTEGFNNSSNNNDFLILNNNFHIKNKAKQSDKAISLYKHYSIITCRICFLEQISIDNPLINPCHCTGSIGNIHIECLRKWLEGKLITRTYAYLIVHSFKDLKCEICNGSLPERVILNGKKIYLINLKLPKDDDYIILETISIEKKDIKFLYIIHMPNKTSLLMGRSSECDIRMTDISISRIHAYLKNINGKFYILDNNSKFGTLIKLQSDVIILPSKPITIQYNEYLFSFYMKKSIWSVLCCKKYNYINLYQEYNDYLIKKPNLIECGLYQVNLYANNSMNENNQTPTNQEEESMIDNENAIIEYKASTTLNKIIDEKRKSERGGKSQNENENENLSQFVLNKRNLSKCLFKNSSLPSNDLMKLNMNNEKLKRKSKLSKERSIGGCDNKENGFGKFKKNLSFNINNLCYSHKNINSLQYFHEKNKDCNENNDNDIIHTAFHKGESFYEESNNSNVNLKNEIVSIKESYLSIDSKENENIV